MSNKISRNIHQLFKIIIQLDFQKGEICQQVIKNELLAEKPSMIARFGSTEIKAILFPTLPWALRSIIKNRVFSNMETLSGFYPSDETSIRKFSKLMIEDMQLLDILGSWRIEERFLIKNFPSAKLVQLNALEPYLQDNPWSEVLKGKKVLVVHPFSETIASQYHNNREKLFKDARVLPEFKSLTTIKAIQSIAGNQSPFKDWFSALDYMKSQIDLADFDIAVIGCGAYGFSLAAHVKRIGKKAIHLGGPTQILFGIKGKRWLDYPDFSPIINEYFVFPDPEDKPKHFTKVEGGCYW